MATERLSPESIHEAGNMNFNTGLSVAVIQDDPDAPDNTFHDTITAGSLSRFRADFPTPYAALSGDQVFKAWVRKVGTGTTNPSVIITLTGGGTGNAIAVSQNIEITSTTGQLISLTWNGGLVAGANAQCMIEMAAQTGTASTHTNFGVGAIEWNANLADPPAAEATFPVNASDTFDRANSTTTLGNTTEGWPWFPHAGTWGITNNTAYRVGTAGAHSFNTVQSNWSDGKVAVTVSGGMTGGGGVCFRMSPDGNSGWFVEANTAGEFYKLVSGTYTIVKTGFTWAVGDLMEARFSGPNIEVFRNGVSRFTVTDSFNETATRHGLRDYFGNIRFDNWSMTSNNPVGQLFAAFGIPL